MGIELILEYYAQFLTADEILSEVDYELTAPKGLHSLSCRKSKTIMDLRLISEHFPERMTPAMLEAFSRLLQV